MLLAALAGTEAALIGGVAIVATGGGRVGDPRRSLLARHDLDDLTGRRAAARAARLRPGLDPHAAPGQRGIRLLRVDGCDVWMSWEDVALVVMGPRANKTSALAVPAVLSAPGLVIATSNKADLWALTSGCAGRPGRCGRSTRKPSPTPPRPGGGTRCARSATPPKPTATRPHPGSPATSWAPSAAPDATRSSTPPANKSSSAPCSPPPCPSAPCATSWPGCSTGAATPSPHSTGPAPASKPPTSKPASAAPTSPPKASSKPPAPPPKHSPPSGSCAGSPHPTPGAPHPPHRHSPDTPSFTPDQIVEGFAELDPWRLLADATAGPVTVHLLSKEGAGTAAPVVAALVDRLLEVAELTAQAAGGRLDPPVVAVLDEAANICPIPTLPQLYSHFGSRGIAVITMLQSYQQGVGVWGHHGMDALWSAATVKLVGAGVDDHDFLRRLSGLIGDHDVEKISTSHGRGTGPPGSTPPPANPSCPSPPCARCPAPTPSCSPPAAAPGSANCSPGTANPTPPTSPATPPPPWPSSATPPAPPSAPTTPSPRKRTHRQRSTDSA